MGKAVPQNIKSRANSLVRAYPDLFSKDFDKNKVLIDSFNMSLSKTQRNLIAGYISRAKEKLTA